MQDSSVNVLVIGNGAREHALCWALRRSPRLGALFCAPGNAGTGRLATNIPIGGEAIDELAAWATEQRIGLTVVGPEVPLAAGLVDCFVRRGLRAFGPTSRAAELESSKVWAGGFFERQGIPAPTSRQATTVADGLRAVAELGLPIAIKADGLAAGKGVVLASTEAEASRTLAWMLEEQGLGQAGVQVLLQELLTGTELSVLALSDGRDLVVLPPARDYKAIGDGNLGPNTGGMGAYSPPRIATGELLARVRAEVLEPTIWGMAAEGRPFRGVLYAGLMLTARGPRVLEFNCRFGDPETQVILPRLASDLLDLLEAATEGNLRSVEPVWRAEVACGVVLASRGYPGPYPVGRPIDGIDSLPSDSLVFQAGTDRRGQRLVTSGGRVLTAVGLGQDVAAARQAAYELAGQIQFDGCYYRTDIAADDESA